MLAGDADLMISTWEDEITEQRQRVAGDTPGSAPVQQSRAQRRRTHSSVVQVYGVATRAAPVVVIHVVAFVLGIGVTWFDSAAVVGTEGPDFVAGRGTRLWCGACAPVGFLDVFTAIGIIRLIRYFFALAGLAVRRRRVDRHDGGEGRCEGDPRSHRNRHYDGHTDHANSGAVLVI